MKTVFSVLAFFLLAVVLWGCPYKSDVGIDEKPAIDIDKSLLGTWHKQTYPYDSTELVFKKLSGKKYSLAVKVSDGEKGYDSFRYEAWFSKVNKWTLLSLFNTETKKYSFGEAVLTGNELNLKLLSEDITTEQFTTTEAMKRFVENIYLQNEVLYDTDTDLTDLLKNK